MKKSLYTLICVLLLISVTLGAAGGASDPLISLAYLNGEYRTGLLTELDAAVKKSYDTVYLGIETKIDSGRPLLPPEGYTHAAKYKAVAIYPGQTLTLSQGTGFALKSGVAAAAVTGGAALDLTSGAALGAAFTPAVGRRYFLAEGAAAELSPDGAVTLLIDGYYKLDGAALDHHPVFTDVKVKDWFYSAVNYAYANGLFSGTSATTFSPQQPMTRGMFVTVLGRLAGIDGEAFTTQSADAFPDVDAAQYYAPYVAWASANGIVLGYDDGTFKPNLSVTREQMAAVMYRYAYWRKEDLTVTPGAGQTFPDFPKISSYALVPMQWAVDKGVLTGSDGKLLPQDTATRAQVAQIVKNFTSR
ncbi:MAG: S-layer homology domain-containing protein [Oscillospiraceae bacterium]|jgi:hypothetical protein|nr:S-layer homology domain-containing protein [Oscillospiraceae bacterium]